MININKSYDCNCQLVTDVWCGRKHKTPQVQLTFSDVLEHTLSNTSSFLKIHLSPYDSLAFLVTILLVVAVDFFLLCKNLLFYHVKPRASVVAVTCVGCVCTWHKCAGEGAPAHARRSKSRTLVSFSLTLCLVALRQGLSQNSSFPLLDKLAGQKLS